MKEQQLTVRHVLAVCTGMFISFAPAAIVFNVWGIFVVPVTGELQVATNQFTFYVAILFLAAAVMSPFMGRLLERLDLRLVGTVSVGVCALGVSLGSFYTEAWQFYFSGLIEGMGIIALNFLLIPTLINRWFTANNGLLLGICMSMTGVGGAVWNFVGGLIIGGMGWRVAYLILGVIAATAMLATLFCIRSYPADAGLQPYGRTKQADASGAEALRRGVPEKVALGSATFGLTFAAIDVLSPTIGRYLFGPREYTRIYSRVTIAVNLAGAVGVTLLATLSDFGWAATFGSTLALIALGLALVLAAIHAGKRLVFTVE